MLDAARQAREFMVGKTRQSLEREPMLVHSIVRLIEIIGEAAAQVSREFQNVHPEIPWAMMVAMRNRLIHAYFDVDLDQVWNTISEDLPPLIAQLERLTRS